jgi:hypothetical protein
MADSFISVPNNIDDIVTLKRFLQELVNKLNEIFGLSGDTKFLTEQTFAEKYKQLQDLIKKLDKVAYLDKENEFDKPISYKGDLWVTENQLPQLSTVKKLIQDLKNYCEQTYEKQENLIPDIDTNSNNIKLSNLPTSDPGVAGQLWNDNGTVKVSSG